MPDTVQSRPLEPFDKIFWDTFRRVAENWALLTMAALGIPSTAETSRRQAAKATARPSFERRTMPAIVIPKQAPWSFADIEVGWQLTSEPRIITARDIEKFADVSGDRNPLHLDDEEAKRSAFGQRIAHGMLVGSLISTALANTLRPYYLEQFFRFRAPVHIDDALETKITVTAVEISRKLGPLVFFDTVVRKAVDGTVVIDGYAVVGDEKSLPRKAA